MSNIRIHRKSRVIISVCQDLETGTNSIVHLNATVDDLDELIEFLVVEKKKLKHIIKTGVVPEFTINKYTGGSRDELTL